ncbi:MAG: DnaD domain protein [Coprobacillus sp.]|nr:DnaD domain protein [Coprobacillus sp.]
MSMITNAIDFRYLLLDNYKKLKISEDEVIVLLMIDQLIRENNALITADLLSLKMNYDPKKIDDIIASLLKKRYIEFKTSANGTITSLDPLNNILFNDFKLSAAEDDESNINPSKKEMEDTIYTSFEKLLNRNLSPVEVDKITAWIQYGYSEETIINALKEALSKNKKSLREVDRILLNWEKKEDRQNEGLSTNDENWDKNLEKTVDLAKTPWVKKDE